MSWFSDLAGKAESLLNNLDEQTGAALRNHNVSKPRKIERNDYTARPIAGAVPKKRLPRSTKKITPPLENRSNYVPSRKTSPTSYYQSNYSPPTKGSPMSHQSRLQAKEASNVDKSRANKRPISPSRKSSPRYTLCNTPMTMVGDVLDNSDTFGLRQRRLSLPTDLDTFDSEDWMYKYQNLEVENAMLKNELNVMNKEVSELLDRLRRTEDGNDVDSPDLKETQMKIENPNQSVTFDNSTLALQLTELKNKVDQITTGFMAKTKEQNIALEKEVASLNNRNRELEECVQELKQMSSEKESAQLKLENEMRHAQSTISDLQSNLEKSTQECQRLERDWEAYKLRVKSMLHSKDNEIKALKEGEYVSEDTKLLTEQIERLKEERDDLSDAIIRVRNECSDMKQYMEQLELRHNSAERVVLALRDALRDERAARNKAEAQTAAFSKELKAIEMETGQTIASLRTALRDKDEELNRVRETSSSVRGSNTSALNVADYDVRESIDNEKIHCLTQTLVQKQTKIDNLLAQNNMLKIQMDKLESKYKTEVTSVRANANHSVVHFQDGDGRSRPRTNHEAALSSFSMRLGVTLKRYPIIRLFVFGYMICLHFWVLTVLFTNTPPDFVVTSKS